MSAVVLVLLGLALVVAAIGWGRRTAAAAVPVTVVLLAAAAVLAAVQASAAVDGRAATTLLIVLAGGLAVAGGGPVTSRVFALVDGPDSSAGSMSRAGEVLRGGAWIGALERGAIFATLVAGWPEGLAIVLGLKGLGRYPELRNEERTGTAERFIIGTFTSVLWAVACAGVARLLT